MLKPSDVTKGDLLQFDLNLDINRTNGQPRDKLKNLEDEVYEFLRVLDRKNRERIADFHLIQCKNTRTGEIEGRWYLERFRKVHDYTRTIEKHFNI